MAYHVPCRLEKKEHEEQFKLNTSTNSIVRKSKREQLNNSHLCCVSDKAQYFLPPLNLEPWKNLRAHYLTQDLQKLITAAELG